MPDLPELHYHQRVLLDFHYGNDDYQGVSAMVAHPGVYKDKVLVKKPVFVLVSGVFSKTKKPTLVLPKNHRWTLTDDTVVTIDN